MVISEDEGALLQFNRKAGKLERYSFARYIFSQSSGVTISWEAERGVEVALRKPPDEAIDALVLTFRFFMQNNEACSLFRLAQVYERIGATEPEKATEFDAIRNRLNAFLDSPSTIEVNGERLTFRRILEGFVYGDLSHENPAKRADFTLWMDRWLTEPLVWNEFVYCLGRLLHDILAIRDVNAAVIQKATKTAFDEGVELARGNEWESAVAKFERAVVLLPTVEVSRKNLATAYLRTGRLQDAIRELGEVAERHPSCEKFVELARMFFHAQDGRRSFWAAREAVKLDGESVDARCVLARALGVLASESDDDEEAEKLWDESEQTLSKALDLLNATDSESAEVHVILGRMHLHLGQQHESDREWRLLEAENELAEALRIMPHSVEALCALGDLFVQTGRPSAAETAFSRAVESDPQHPQGLVGLGHLYLRGSEWAKAAETFERLRPFFGDTPALLSDLGFVYIRLGNLERAEAYLNEALAKGEELVSVHVNLSCLYAEQGRHEEAITAVERALELDPGNELAAHNREKLLAESAQL